MLVFSAVALDLSKDNNLDVIVLVGVDVRASQRVNAVSLDGAPHGNFFGRWSRFGLHDVFLVRSLHHGRN